MTRFDRYVMLFGRIFVASIFLVGALAKIVAFSTTTAEMRDFGLPSTEFFAVAAIAVELLGGALLVTGYKTRPTAGALVGYVVFVTAVIHHDISVPLNLVFAVSNIGLLGGLLLLAGRGAESPSVDTWLVHRIERADLQPAPLRPVVQP
jgi:putative oxidoreductase